MLLLPTCNACLPTLLLSLSLLLALALHFVALPLLSPLSLLSLQRQPKQTEFSLPSDEALRKGRATIGQSVLMEPTTASWKTCWMLSDRVCGERLLPRVSVFA